MIPYRFASAREVVAVRGAQPAPDAWLVLCRSLGVPRALKSCRCNMAADVAKEMGWPTE
jgi:hypothetical protein